VTWDYRVIKTNNGGETWFGVHEVHYDEDGALWAYTEEPIAIESESEEGLPKVFEQMLQALERPVLMPEAFPTQPTPT